MSDTPETAEPPARSALRRRWFAAAALVSFTGAAFGWFSWQRHAAGSRPEARSLDPACSADAGALKPWEEFRVPSGKDSPVEVCRCVNTNCCSCYELPNHRFERSTGIRSENSASR